MESRLLEVNQLANQSQIQLNDTTDVLKSLEERLKNHGGKRSARSESAQLDLGLWENSQRTFFSEFCRICLCNHVSGFYWDVAVHS
jgi:hypothetical protein